MQLKWLFSLSLLLVSAATAAAEEGDAAPQITLGNGDANWIVIEGATREGATFTFSEVHVDGNSWLVMHGFKDGNPVGTDYVGATYLDKGDNRDVQITVDSEPVKNEMYIVMLHLHSVGGSRYSRQEPVDDCHNVGLFNQSAI